MFIPKALAKYDQTHPMILYSMSVDGQRVAIPILSTLNVIGLAIY